VKTYTTDDRFDIQTGMPVFEAGGRKIGLVTDIAGFGSSHVASSGGPADSQPVIRAAVSTGHFGVAELLGSGPSHLRLRFADIHEVLPEHGVTLTEAAVASLEGQRAASESPSALTNPKAPGSIWRLRSLWRRKAPAAAADA
jgi:hypothetical protein